MGKQQRERAVVFRTHKAFYAEIPAIHDVVLIENVPEYGVTVAKTHLPPHWSFRHVTIDPRLFGIAAGRTRIFILAWNSKTVKWSQDHLTLECIIDALGARTIGGAGDFFWMKKPTSVLTHSQAPW